MNSLFLIFLLQTFQFTNANLPIEGYLALPDSQPPKALILYFHRAIEDRSAVKDWGALLTPKGFAVAGYTASKNTTELVAEARAALSALRKNKALANIPVYAAGASMGSRAASALFAADPQIRGLILIVPGGDQVCAAFAKSADRPVLLIQAAKDEIVPPGVACEIQQCLPKKNATHHLLPNATHRFPASTIAPKIIDWLVMQASRDAGVPPAK